MKKIIILGIAGLVLASCKEQEGEKTIGIPRNSDLVRLNLSGKVKRVEEIPYYPDSLGQPGILDSCCISISHFNEKGYITSTVTKNGLGDVKDETIHMYYKNGHVKEIVTLAHGRKKNSLTVQLDGEGRYSEAQNFDSSGRLEGFYTNLEENDYGAVIKGIYRNPDSSIRHTFISVYDKAFYTNGYQLDSSGRETSYNEYRADERGNTIAFLNRELINDSVTTRRRTYTYDRFDETGNWTQRTTYDETGKATRIVIRQIEYFKP